VLIATLKKEESILPLNRRSSSGPASCPSFHPGHEEAVQIEVIEILWGGKSGFERPFRSLWSGTPRHSFRGLQLQVGDLVAREKKVTVETVFSEREHKIESCMKGLATSYLDLQDSVLWVDPDSTLRIKPPSLPGSEPYHAHLEQRVGGQRVDQFSMRTLRD